MISASTIASGSSSGFSAMGSASTPQSSYTPSSAKPTSGNSSGNPLKDLIETEKEYLDTLKIITTVYSQFILFFLTRPEICVPRNGENDTLILFNSKLLPYGPTTSARQTLQNY